MTTADLEPCCEHGADHHWPEGNCKECLACSCDWFGERRGLPVSGCRCRHCRPDLVGAILSALDGAE